jgi:hypothetical protein
MAARCSKRLLIYNHQPDETKPLSRTAHHQLLYFLIDTTILQIYLIEIQCAGSGESRVSAGIVSARAGSAVPVVSAGVVSVGVLSTGIVSAEVTSARGVSTIGIGASPSIRWIKRYVHDGRVRSMLNSS